MPSVFITQTGRKYHARTDLECLAKAQGFFSVDLATASDGGLRPCIGCDAPGLPGVTEGDSQWLRRIDEWSESRKFDSLWEQVFSVRVLAKTPNITVDDVEIQSYVNAGENTYKVDFLISKARLVIEVDGFQKNNAPPSPTDQEQRNRRDAALMAAGYRVLHFTNVQVQSEPNICCQTVSDVLDSGVAATPQEVAPQPVAATPQEVAPQPVVLKDSKSSRIWLYVGLALAVLIVSLFLIVNQVDSGKTDDTAVLPTNGDCPNSYPFKGNVKSDGELIVHAPGQQFYERTKAEMCFQSIEAAASDGYRKSKI
jgi:very-short-patch-repair endonuclease